MECGHADTSVLDSQPLTLRDTKPLVWLFVTVVSGHSSSGTGDWLLPAREAEGQGTGKGHVLLWTVRRYPMALTTSTVNVASHLALLCVPCPQGLDLWFPFS